MLSDSVKKLDNRMEAVSKLATLRISRADATRSYLAIVTESSYAEIMTANQDWFHSTEWLRVSAFNVEKRRKEFVLGRCAGKLAASAFLEESNLSRLVIEVGVFGQPIMRNCSDCYLELSITHTDTIAIAVASEYGCPIGVDIEKLSDRDVNFLVDHITKNDLRLLADLTPSKQHAYLRAWTIKEALSKALRCGITIPFALLELESTSAIDAHSLCCSYRNFPQYQCYSWSLGQYLIAITVPWSINLEVDAELLRAHLEQKAIP